MLACVAGTTPFRLWGAGWPELALQPDWPFRLLLWTSRPRFAPATARKWCSSPPARSSWGASPACRRKRRRTSASCRPFTSTAPRSLAHNTLPFLLPPDIHRRRAGPTVCRPPARKNFPSPTSAGPTPSATRCGPASVCPPKLSGKKRRAARTDATSPGAMPTTPPAATRTAASYARSARFRRAPPPTVVWTCRAMPGNGRPTGSSRIQARLPARRISAGTTRSCAAAAPNTSTARPTPAPPSSAHGWSLTARPPQARPNSLRFCAQETSTGRSGTRAWSRACSSAGVVSGRAT